MSSQAAFLQIVRLGIGHSADLISEEIDWNDIQVLAEKQGLSAIIVDGVERLPEHQRPPKSVLLQWIGEALLGYEYRYELYRRSIAELASFYNQHGLKMMVLKGYACSMNWPKAEHRPCGDIDIWQFGKQKEADALLVKEKGIEIDKSHHHHTVFYWRDFMVENHYDFINTKDLKSSKDLETVFKELGQDESYYVELYGEKVYLPSPNLHALFLLRHALLHFVSTSINLRQILDWGLFVKAHNKDVDWSWLIEVLEKYKMKEFFDCINAICVDNLGFETKIFPYVQYNPCLKDQVLKDTLSPKFTEEDPRSLFARTIYKIRRWNSNAWKQKMCYTESRLSVFIRSLWAHLIKPALL
jgi:hypothetical protein